MIAYSAVGGITGQNDKVERSIPRWPTNRAPSAFTSNGDWTSVLAAWGGDHNNEREHQFSPRLSFEQTSDTELLIEYVQTL